MKHLPTRRDVLATLIPLLTMRRPSLIVAASMLLVSAMHSSTVGRSFAPSATSDVVIVGAGISGLSAALEAARGGAAVTVIDMSSVFGGHAVMSEGGVSIVDSPLHRSSGFQDSPQLAYEAVLPTFRDYSVHLFEVPIATSWFREECFNIMALYTQFHAFSIERTHLSSIASTGCCRSQPVRPVTGESSKVPTIVIMPVRRSRQPGIKPV